MEVQPKMPYRVGFCPCCNKQIMARSVNGVWSAQAPNFSQVDLYFENGRRVRTTICKACLADPDLEKIWKAIIDDGSQATTENYRKMIKDWGCPVKLIPCIK